jgi:hypothetical protein
MEVRDLRCCPRGEKSGKCLVIIEGFRDPDCYPTLGDVAEEKER